MIILPILTASLTHSSLKGWENVLFDLGSGRVKLCWNNCFANISRKFKNIKYNISRKDHQHALTNVKFDVRERICPGVRKKLSRLAEGVAEGVFIMSRKLGSNQAGQERNTI